MADSILLKDKLDKLYIIFNNSIIYDDPLIYPKKFNNFKDIEFTSFISSLFSYGNIKQILKIIDFFYLTFGNTPVKKLKNSKISELLNLLNNIKYRFYSEKDIVLLFLQLRRIYSEYDSLLTYTKNKIKTKEITAKNIISAISSNMRNEIKKLNNNQELSHGLKFMFPLPENNGTCKRMNMFLRWTIRKDNIDLGIWDLITADKLIIPVDTHIARIAIKLKLTTLKNPSWKMAEQITANLKKFDASDPVKYDYSLCHIGIRKLKLQDFKEAEVL